MKRRDTYRGARIALLLAALGLTLTACPAPGQLEYAGSDGTGSLLVLVGGGAARTLVPETSMEPAAAVVRGAGPSGASFELATDGATLQVTNLAAGTWTVSADILNEEGLVIGTGSAKASVSPGVTESVSIGVNALEGSGTLELTVNWRPGDVAYPAVKGTLTPVVGEPTDLVFEVGEGKAVASVADVPAGYHTLSVQLLDGTQVVMGTIEMARVASDQGTSGVFDFYEINRASLGSLDIRITPDLGSPLNVKVTGAIAEIPPGKTLTVQASVPEYAGNVVCAWYINGSFRATGESFRTPADLEPGIYNLDVTALSADGRRGGSASWTFRVVEGARMPRAEWFNGVTVTEDGSVMVVGAGADLDGELHPVALGASYDSAGALLWRFDDSAAVSELNAVAVEPSGDLVAVGWQAIDGQRDWLMRRIRRADGSTEPLTKVSVGGAGADVAYDVAVDAKGNIFVVGVVEDPDSGQDWTVYSFDTEGALRWSAQLGSRNGVLRAAAVDLEGNLYVAGSYEFSPGNPDWLIRKFPSSGGATVQSFKPDWIGGAGEDSAYDITVGPGGNIYVVGSLQGATRDWAIYCLGPADATEQWHARLGRHEGALYGAAAASDFVYVAGHYEFSSGDRDWLIRRFAPNGGDSTAGADQSWKPAAFGGVEADEARAVALDAKRGILWVAGAVSSRARLIRYDLPSCVETVVY